MIACILVRCSLDDDLDLQEALHGFAVSLAMIGEGVGIWGFRVIGIG